MDKLMIVCEYDLPPFYLAAELEEMRNDGSCKPHGFDFFVTPIKILPYDFDRIEQLKKLGDRLKRDIEVLRRSVKADAQRVMFIK